MLSEVEIHLNVDTQHRFTEKEDVDREFALWYYSDKTGKAAAEEAFHISNAPDEIRLPHWMISINWFGADVDKLVNPKIIPPEWTTTNQSTQ